MFTRVPVFWPTALWDATLMGVACQPAVDMSCRSGIKDGTGKSTCSKITFMDSLSKCMNGGFPCCPVRFPGSLSRMVWAKKMEARVAWLHLNTVRVTLGFLCPNRHEQHIHFNYFLRQSCTGTLEPTSMQIVWNGHCTSKQQCRMIQDWCRLNWWPSIFSFNPFTIVHLGLSEYRVPKSPLVYQHFHFPH